MASAHQGYKIVTLNMGEKASAIGNRALKRKKLLQTTLQNIAASLIFCQELPGKFNEVVDEHYKYGTSNNGTEAGIAWLVKDFQGCTGSPSTEDWGIIEIKKRLAKDSSLDVEELLKRVDMVKLTTKEERESDRTTFLAVSWHGPHKTKEKSKVFLGLIRFCKDVCEMLGGIPFIIGGDFNFDTSELDKVNLNKEEIDRPLHYPQSQRAIKLKETCNYISYKDNFVFSQDTISLTAVKSFDFESDISKPKMQEILGKTALVNVLDHDPILAMLMFSRPAPEEDEGVRSVTKGIEEMLDSLRRFTGRLF